MLTEQHFAGCSYRALSNIFVHKRKNPFLSSLPELPFTILCLSSLFILSNHLIIVCGNSGIEPEKLERPAVIPLH